MAPISLTSFKKFVYPGAIFYFKSPQLKKTTEPHHQVVIGLIDKNTLLFGICTKQFEKRQQYFERNGFAEVTLVRIKKSAYNLLKLHESFVDCNYPKCFDISDLHLLFNNGEAKITGVVSEDEFEQLKTGISASILIERERKLIVNKTEYKKSIF